MQARSVCCAAVILMLITACAAMAQSVPAAKPNKKHGTSSATTQEDVQKLRELLAAQQQQLNNQSREINELRSEVQQLLGLSRPANAASDKEQSSAQQAQQTATDAKRLAEEASSGAMEAKAAIATVNSTDQQQNKKLTQISELLDRFHFSGDVRLRGESLFQGSPGFADRNRARIRARFGFESELNQDFTAGVFLATGSLADLTSANETLTNFFERKTIGLDRAYITYQPVAHPWLELTGGKFLYTWRQTSLTFDPDINPEGFSQKFSWKLENPVIKNLTVGAVQLLYNESAAGSDSYALGGQASTTLHFGPWIATPQFFTLKWNNPSAILQASAFAVQATKGTDSAGDTIFLPGEGPGCAAGSAGTTKLPSTAPCALASNGMTNAVFTDPVTRLPHLLSGFFYTDYLLENEISTGSERFPLNLTVEFQNNLDAAKHPVDTNGNVIPSLGPQGKGYLADMSLGRTKNKNDIRFGYGFWRQEQDAILATFSESEQRASTNILEHHIYALWRLRHDTVAAFNLWHGRTLNTSLQNNAAFVQNSIAKPGQTEPYLNRYQFDLIYTF